MLEMHVHDSSISGYFNTWQLELQKERDGRERSHNVARILRKNSLCRILQAWRVVNQEECIIGPLVKRRQRKDMARFVLRFH